MPHAHSPRKNKVDNRLYRRQGGDVAQIMRFPVEKARMHKNNLVPRLGSEVQDILTTIFRRYESADQITQRVTAEIIRAERQYRALFEGQEEYMPLDDDDNRIFLRKTMENHQVVHAHLDNLMGQLDPLLVLTPAVKGIYPLAEEFRRAKVKELLVNFYLSKTRFRDQILPRWRNNFLRHPSAYLRVVYDTDAQNPDIQIDVVDRAALWIDPTITTGNIKDAGWVIEKDFVPASYVEYCIEQGYYYADSTTDMRSYSAATTPMDSTLREMLGNSIWAGQTGAEGDEPIERWHYWQSPRNGQPHAYGVVIGGKGGQLVYYGDNPYPYKGIPYRGKSYLPDTYRPDGDSLAYQYRSIQELYNTFWNLRIDDVLENVKRRIFIVEQLFNETTQKDHENDQKYVRLASDFAQQILANNKRIGDFMFEPNAGDSTQHLLSDMQWLNAEGQQSTSTSDVFRGQNPQSGATLGQVQEQLFRALGVFRPIFKRETALCEEVGEIICTYFEDEEFFGSGRIAQIVGKNRYKDIIDNFYYDSSANVYARAVTPDEMDVDVLIDVTNQAEAKASRTMENSIIAGLLDGLRHHQGLMEEAQDTINFPALILRFLQNSGQDIDALQYTDQQRQQRAAERQEKQNQAIQQQNQILSAQEQMKAQGKALVEAQRAKGQLAIQDRRIAGEHASRRDELLLEAVTAHQAKMEEMHQQFLHDMQLMMREAALERANEGVNVNR